MVIAFTSRWALRLPQLWYMGVLQWLCASLALTRHLITIFADCGLQESPRSMSTLAGAELDGAATTLLCKCSSRSAEPSVHTVVWKGCLHVSQRYMLALTYALLCGPSPCFGSTCHCASVLVSHGTRNRALRWGALALGLNFTLSHEASSQSGLSLAERPRFWREIVF